MSDAIEIGTVLRDSWRITRLLGSGASATVYAAKHVRTGAEAAIKVLKPELASNAAARFEQEGRLASRIPHRGVVRVIDDGTLPDTIYLVLELVQGETLKERWLRRGKRVPLAEVAPIVSELLDVLAVAHEQGIVHRDIKPDNVLLGRDGSVKLADFGIAKLLGGDRGLTRTGMMLGTPAFMAPEQALGRFAEVDATTDLFALAVTARTVMSGRLLYDGSNVAEQIVGASRPIRPTSADLPDLPEPVAQVLDRALSADKPARFSDARAMLEAWSAALGAAGLGPAARSRTRGAALAFALVIAVGGVGIGAFALAQAGKAPQASSSASSTAPVSPSGEARTTVAPTNLLPPVRAPASVAAPPEDACSMNIDELLRLIKEKFGEEGRLMSVSLTIGGANVAGATAANPDRFVGYTYWTATNSMTMTQHDARAPTRSRTFALGDFRWQARSRMCADARRRFAADGGTSGSAYGFNVDTKFGGELYVIVALGTAANMKSYCYDREGRAISCS